MCKNSKKKEVANDEWKKDLEDGKYGSESIKLLYDESDTFLKETIESVRQTMSRSYALLAIYSAFFIFIFSRFEKEGWVHFPSLIFSAVSIAVVMRNLFTASLGWVGRQPKEKINYYYSVMDAERQHAQLQIGKIISNQGFIDQNLKTMKKIQRRFYWSIAMFILAVFMCALSFLLCQHHVFGLQFPRLVVLLVVQYSLALRLFPFLPDCHYFSPGYFPSLDFPCS